MGLEPKEWESRCWEDTQGPPQVYQETEINNYTLDLGPKTGYLKTRNGENSRTSMKKLVSPLGLSSGFPKCDPQTSAITPDLLKQKLDALTNPPRDSGVCTRMKPTASED